MANLRVILSAIAVLALPDAAAAQPYPNRPIKLLVSSPASTSPDVIARVVAAKLAAELGEGVIVENRPGASHTIALKAMAAAEPDGYTLLLGATGSLAVTPALSSSFDPALSKALVPVALLATTPNMLAVAATVPVDSLSGLLAYTKANPEKLSYAAAIGTPPHLMGEYLRARMGLDMVHVPYRGAALSMPDLLSGRIHAIVEGPGVLLAHIRQGKLKPLVVSSATRLPELATMPTLAEAGIADYPPQTWMGIVAPAGTPDAIVAKLNAAANHVLASAELKANLASLGFAAQPSSVPAFATLIATDAIKWAAVVKAAKINLAAGN